MLLEFQNNHLGVSMKKLACLFFVSALCYAQECSFLWNKNLEINPPKPKGYVGDSWAAYALMGYNNKPNLAWHFVSKFPRSRFMSLETYTTTKKLQYDFHLDFQINPSPGSINPFRNGALMDSPLPRNFEVDLVPAEGHSTDPNVIFISPTEDVHAIYYRIYVPSNGFTITEADLPEVYAYDYSTGLPTACPEKNTDVIFDPDLSQAVVAWVTTKKHFDFKSSADSVWANISNSGHNAAIPGYYYALNRVNENQLVHIQFEAPNFLDNASQVGPFESNTEVRYWSLCTQNLAKGQTLSCFADFESTTSTDGLVHLIIGRGPKVAAEARRRGYSFLEDKRESNQKILQMIYRNLLPSETFEKTKMYQNEYNPKGTLCRVSSFLKGEPCENARTDF